jgi:integrase
MFVRANQALGSNWSLHDLRHTAAYRMSRDPLLPLTDVQWVLGHAKLSTTQVYLTPMPGEVIEQVLAHHRRRGIDSAAEQARTSGGQDPPTGGYRPESLATLFSRRTL